jgi:energy-converting hydrogenase Eha subunit B
VANTLTNLFPDLYQALDVVSRELVGFIPAVSRDSTYERAAVGQVVRSFVAPASTASDITPGVTPPDDGNQTIGNTTLQITKSRRVAVRWAGEETRQMSSSFGAMNIRAQQFAQGMRTLCNEVESDLAALHINASRAYGTAGTTAFASDLSDTANIRKILSDNGQWHEGDMHMVIDTTAGAKLRTLTQLTKANEAADASMLRQGVLLDVHGLAFRESAQVKQAVTVGTGTSYQTNNASGYAVGATTIALDTGSGTVLAGDIVTFTGDTNKYVVATALSGGNIVLAAPGLRKTLADNVAMTIVGAATRNMAFTRGAIQLATRAPALPDGGDLAVDRQVITDPRSGLSFEVAMYPQYRQMQYELSLAWGCGITKAEGIALLLG